MKTKITLNDGSALSFGPAYSTEVDPYTGTVSVHDCNSSEVAISLNETAWRSVEIARLDN